MKWVCRMTGKDPDGVVDGGDGEYDGPHAVPPLLLLNRHSLSVMNLMIEWVGELSWCKVSQSTPQQGGKKDIAVLATRLGGGDEGNEHARVRGARRW